MPNCERAKITSGWVYQWCINLCAKVVVATFAHAIDDESPADGVRKHVLFR